jgi:hypothetical protein
MAFSVFEPFRVFEPFKAALGARETTPEQTPEIEFVTSEGQLFFTADSEQLVVQES